MAANNPTNPFDEDDISPDTTPPAHRSSKPSIPLASKSLEDIADILLKEKLILTALELNTELLESGKEISKLRDYFSNPGNFEHVMPQVALTIKSDISEYIPQSYAYKRLHSPTPVNQYALS